MRRLYFHLRAILHFSWNVPLFTKDMNFTRKYIFKQLTKNNCIKLESVFNSIGFYKKQGFYTIKNIENGNKIMILKTSVNVFMLIK